MKIGLLASVRGQEKFIKQYTFIVDYLTKKGHEVEHNLHISPEKIAPMSYADREKLYLAYFEKLMQCDIVIAECSMQSIPVGYALAFLRDHGKPIIVLSIKGEKNDLGTLRGLFSSIENIVLYDYEEGMLSQVLDEALAYMEPKVDKRFTIIFPAPLLAKVEHVAQKKKLPKAVYIRQLIEKSFSESSE